MGSKNIRRDFLKRPQESFLKFFFPCILFLSLLGCDESDNSGWSIYSGPNEATFAVSDGIESVVLTWQSSYPDIGFLDSYSGYFKIYIGENGYYSETTGFHEYLFIDVPSKYPGIYHSDYFIDAGFSLYDSYGNLFMVFSSDDLTWAEVRVETWSDTSITGTFTGILRNFETNLYLGVSGDFISFDSSGNRVSRSIDSSSNVEVDGFLHERYLNERKMISE